jgi:hypothetical protein
MLPGFAKVVPELERPEIARRCEVLAQDMRPRAGGALDAAVS